MFASLLLLGCGPLVGGTYPGEPLYTIEGTVQADLDLGDDARVGVALLWANDDMLSAQSVLVQTRFPARYQLQIFQPPPQASRIEIIGSQALEAHVGQILLYLDEDGSGDWNGLEEPLVGGAYNAAVLYIPGLEDQLEALPPGADVPDRPLWEPSEGFHLVEVAPGPFCTWDWERWLRPADAAAAPLHVGYFDGLQTDWNCDAHQDFEDGVASPNVGQGDGLWDGTCPPTDVLEEECSFIAIHLDEVHATGDPDLLAFIEGWLDELGACHAELCPDVVDRAGAALVP